MANCTTETVTLDLPTETMVMLRAYAAAMNSPLANAASAAIRDGIEAKVLLHPAFIDKMGIPMLIHSMSTASRLRDA